MNSDPTQPSSGAALDKASTGPDAHRVLPKTDEPRPAGYSMDAGAPKDKDLIYAFARGSSLADHPAMCVTRQQEPDQAFSP